MTIKIKGELINFSVPKIMGILNVTPDSFYDGGKYNSEKKILNQVEKMISSGADIIDVGGYSSRPGAKEISIENDKALNGSTILHTISLLKGANILRTHDVLEAVECVKIIRQLNL